MNSDAATFIIAAIAMISWIKYWLHNFRHGTDSIEAAFMVIFCLMTCIFSLSIILILAEIHHILPIFVYIGWFLSGVYGGYQRLFYLDLEAKIAGYGIYPSYPRRSLKNFVGFFIQSGINGAFTFAELKMDKIACVFGMTDKLYPERQEMFISLPEYEKNLINKAKSDSARELSL